MTAVVVIDTNVWVSAFLNPEGFPARLIQSGKTGSFLIISVAARLFDAGLLGNHLSFAAEAVASLSVNRLVYPHRFDALPVVLALLEQHR